MYYPKKLKKNIFFNVQNVLIQKKKKKTFLKALASFLLFFYSSGEDEKALASLIISIFKAGNQFVLYCLLIKIIDFYFPFFYYCLMTPVADNFTKLFHGENKFNYHPLILRFSRIFHWKVADFLPSFTWYSKRR